MAADKEINNNEEVVDEGATDEVELPVVPLFGKWDLTEVNVEDKTLEQHINLNAIPDGRVIMPPLNVNVRGNTHPFLNFAYKLTPNSRATLLLRFQRNWKVYFRFS